VINFLIATFAIFLLVRQVNKLRRQTEAASAAPTTKDRSRAFKAIPVKAVPYPTAVRNWKRRYQLGTKDPGATAAGVGSVPVSSWALHS
jgi:hypothetical protein